MIYEGPPGGNQSLRHLGSFPPFFKKQAGGIGSDVTGDFLLSFLDGLDLT